ncbi:PPOX class F420-dependent oxidoreductase [Aquihabitans sp. McL0605]|uniref:PPOX class F420-dependent oxidoreductase n=1 Tax=Aquihabitans sp. McL0605 TaxID=3415671 RepID=UPI003CEC305B
MPKTLPPSHADLLDLPVSAHLGTVRPDGAPQVSEMWFVWDGEVVRFTHTNNRQKFKNFAHEPRVSFSIADPDDPYRFLEVRGVVESIEPDPNADFYVSLQERYGFSIGRGDAPVRVVVTVRPTGYIAVSGGMTQAEQAAAKG